MRKDTKNWLEMAEYDLQTAEHMLQSGRYVYVIFMCHLSIEKTLKGILTEETSTIPPKTHDLLYLTQKTVIRFTPEMLDFVGMINNASIATRYPRDFSRLVSSYPREVANDYLERTKGVVRWLRQDFRLRES
ncbi:HEPN domain-containing protein [Dehalococcoidia bacterium]|nr:HEPN domain-containing protein [Dehalococcoidia bacterium]MCL0075487.1 HEPN domain-containing protein [Dehalococcoidia bacterium]MCL0076454.1 HEPN domain-containing protein [Dehalococcoidia bacterium]